jgi:hypothetical protein
MISSISAVRDGIKRNLQTITNMRVYDLIPDVVVPPCAVVGQLDFQFDASMARGLDTASCDIFILVQRFSERSGQDKLDEYLAGGGPKSIKAAIESDLTLNGSVKTCRVVSAESGTYQTGDQTYLSYRYNLAIWG